MTRARQYMNATGTAPDNLCWECEGEGSVRLVGTWSDRECFHCRGLGVVEPTADDRPEFTVSRDIERRVRADLASPVQL